MAKPHAAAETATPMLREDGTLYFHYEGKSIGVRLCEWALAILWLLVLAVIVAALLWS